MSTPKYTLSRSLPRVFDLNTEDILSWMHHILFEKASQSNLMVAVVGFNNHGDVQILYRPSVAKATVPASLLIDKSRSISQLALPAKALMVALEISK